MNFYGRMSILGVVFFSQFISQVHAWPVGADIIDQKTGDRVYLNCDEEDAAGRCVKYRFALSGREKLPTFISGDIQNDDGVSIRNLFFDQQYCLQGRGSPYCLKPLFYPGKQSAMRVLTPFSLSQKAGAAGINELIPLTFALDAAMLPLTLPVHGVSSVSTLKRKNSFKKVIQRLLERGQDKKIKHSRFINMVGEIRRMYPALRNG